MLNRIKDKILHVLRNYCGYYELEREYISLKYYSKDIDKKYNKYYKEYTCIEEKLEKLLAQHEAKILEYDILKNQFNDLVDIITNKTPMPEINDLEYIIKCFNHEKQDDYKKYLINELEEILNIMKEKGVHPQDLIKRIITKAKRDIEI